MLLRISLTDWAQNVHSLTVQMEQNAHYVPSLYRVLLSDLHYLQGSLSFTFEAIYACLLHGQSYFSDIFFSSLRKITV